MAIIRRCLYLAIALGHFAPCAVAEEMSFIQNQQIRLGIDLQKGGAITWLSPINGENIINSFDLGRQIQMSFYSGPVPYEEAGQRPADHWRHLGWNPIQTGDDFAHGSRIIEHTNDGSTLHLRCQPMQWPLNNIPAECEFEAWLTLDESAVCGRFRLINRRTDKTQYPARQQELPAVYVNAPFYRLITYTGDQPFLDSKTEQLDTQPKSHHPWISWQATEGWAALVNESGWGLGVWSPTSQHFTGGFAGKPGPNDPKSIATGYIAPLSTETLDYKIEYEYHARFILGTTEEIREYVARQPRPKTPLKWDFHHDRQHWHLENAIDSGWPMNGEWRIHWNHADPQFISPFCLWDSKATPELEINAAFSTTQDVAHLLLHPHGAADFDGAHPIAFKVQTDGEYHVYRVPLPASGSFIRLRLDPPGGADQTGSARIRSIRITTPR